MVNQQGAHGALRELALFAGAGGGIIGGKLLGWETVAAVEWNPYAACVLAARQNDGILTPFPIWDDVQTFDGRPWRGLVDVVSGGFPCQDISAAGRGAGIEGERSGMWKHMARIIGEVRPRFAFVENSPMLLTRGLGVVLSDLAALGYDCKWTVLGAADVGANHKRERLWIYATDPSQQRCDYGGSDWKKRPILHHEHGHAEKSQRQRFGRVSRVGQAGSDVANTQRNGLQGCGCKRCVSGQARLCSGAGYDKEQDLYAATADWWAVEPRLDRVADGVAARVDRLKAIGNGQVPLCAATAFNLLK